MVVAFGGAESPEGDSLYAYPARESLWSPNGVAKIMQGAKPVRLAAEAFLLFVQKEPKYAWGCAPRPPNAKLRLDTNDAKHRPYSAADTLIRCLRRILYRIAANQQQKVMLPGLSFLGATKTPYE